MISIKSGDPDSIGSRNAERLNKALRSAAPSMVETTLSPSEDTFKAAQPDLKEPSKRQQHDSDSDIDEDDDDNDPTITALREKRLAAMKRKFTRIQEFKALGHGVYSEIVEEQFLSSVTKSKFALCHFFHSDFERCKIMDKHLALLAPKYLPTRFIKLNAEKAPFFVGKLQVKTLPTVILFKDGIATDRLTGFDELGKTDEFSTKTLEKRLQKSGVIVELDDNENEKLGDDELHNTHQSNSIRTGGRGAGDWDDEDNEVDDT